LGESHLERAFRMMLKEEVRKLNQHMPKERKSLRTLLNEQTPSVETLDGGSTVMKKMDLQRLAEVVPPSLHEKIRLPIIVQRRFDLGSSIYTVSGSALEEFTVKCLLGLTDGEFDHYEAEGRFHIYRPHLAELVRMIHSLVVIGFGIPEGLASGVS
jgi:uncharacterized protein (UPF0216 family)